MSTLFQRQFSKLAGALFAAATLMAASPVLANSSSNAAAADVAEPIREAQGGTLATGDKKFRELFATWVALDKAGPDAPVERAIVAIPSRMPLAGSVMTSGYGMRDHPVLKRRARHKGVDLAAPTGTPVYATADGVIERADWFSSYGLYISIDHGADLETRYAHLSRLAVAAGERVRKGDLIGYVGSTGRSTGPHLHYEVRVDGVAVNPIPYMVDREPRVAANEQLTGQGGD
ncbi:M23 family metallopeptidase [Erythrobacter sp. JK5]|uniref:M23 family metallopeptidase n=1 Tax=Erythrobacter sp. JK5 TaxID=2829500 RepID=UPI001BADAD5E|nr:M23 family metallopeptidase [Erythrobacter sp. JK5]QUL37141.1 M23 family metallopeptidase [Erythrobacter sp. JK5]